MRSYLKILILTLAAVAIAACGASSKAADAPATTPADETTGHHDMASHGGETGGHHDMASSTDGLADLKPVGEAQVGDNTTCPVSGKEFTVTADNASVEHDGKTYYFCCPGCDKKFREDPAKYIKP